MRYSYVVMRLITPQLASELPAIGSILDHNEEQLIARALFVSVVSPAKWLIFGYDPETEIVYCYADLYGAGREGGAEFGDTYVPELEALRLMPFGWPAVMNAEGFPPMPFLECVDNEGRIIA